MLDWIRNRFRRGPVVPVVRLSGVIASGGLLGGRSLSMESVAPLLKRAFETRGAKAVALSRRAPLAIQATRRMLRRRHEEIRTYLREELETQRGLRKTKDAQEAIKAFIEKRPPVWSGS